MNGDTGSILCQPGCRNLQPKEPSPKLESWFRRQINTTLYWDGADDALAIDQWLSELTLDDVREAINVANGGGHASWNHYFGDADTKIHIGHSRSLLDAAGDAASAAMEAASAASSAASDVGELPWSPPKDFHCHLKK